MTYLQTPMHVKAHVAFVDWCTTELSTSVHYGALRRATSKQYCNPPSSTAWKCFAWDTASTL